MQHFSAFIICNLICCQHGSCRLPALAPTPSSALLSSGCACAAACASAIAAPRLLLHAAALFIIHLPFLPHCAAGLASAAPARRRQQPCLALSIGRGARHALQRQAHNKRHFQIALFCRRRHLIAALSGFSGGSAGAFVGAAVCMPPFAPAHLAVSSIY